MSIYYKVFFFFQAEDGIRDYKVTGVQTCALPISQSRIARETDTVRGKGRLTGRGRQGPKTRDLAHEEGVLPRYRIGAGEALCRDEGDVGGIPAAGCRPELAQRLARGIVPLPRAPDEHGIGSVSREGAHLGHVLRGLRDQDEDGARRGEGAHRDGSTSRDSTRSEEAHRFHSVCASTFQKYVTRDESPTESGSAATVSAVSTVHRTAPSLSYSLKRYRSARGTLDQTSRSTRGTDARGAIGTGASALVRDRKSTRLNSSHLVISYAVFCLKKKKKKKNTRQTTSHTHTLLS